MLTRRGFVPVRRRRGSRAGASRGAPPRRRARALPRAPEASGRPGADGADGPAGSGIVAPANSASSASPPTASTDRGATASTSHHRSTRSGSVLRGAGHCPPPRFRSWNPAAIHDLIPYHRPSAWSGSRSVDPFPEIEKLMTWEAFLASVEEAAKLAGPEDFDHLALVGNGYSYIRRYSPEFLNAFEFRAAPASEELLQAIHVLRDLNAKNARAVPRDMPTGFVRRRWKPHVFEGEEINRRFYELCVLSELRNALRSGDLWVVGSRQFRDFEEYLLLGRDLRGHEAQRVCPWRSTPAAGITWSSAGSNSMRRSPRSTAWRNVASFPTPRWPMAC